MMRGPRNWAVAVRKPDGEIAQVARPIDSAMARHWVLRLPIVRGVVALGESLAIGFRALSVSANYAVAEAGRGASSSDEAGRDRPLGALLLLRGRDRLRGRRLQGRARRCSPTRCRSRTASCFVLVEGLIRITIFVGYLALLSADPVAQARLRVPRRRAQGDQRLRGRRGADPGDRAALLADPPALRHLVPVLGGRAERLRLRALRAAPAGSGSSSRGSPSCR